MEEWEIIAEYEGYSVEEAKLSYASRKELPKSAFCGPDRSFPAHDAAHVRNGIARLAQNKVLPPAVKAKILACLKRRAKRFGVEVSETATTSPADQKELDGAVMWYLRELGIQ
jgi:hypothetical protein